MMANNELRSVQTAPGTEINGRSLGSSPQRTLKTNQILFPSQSSSRIENRKKGKILLKSAAEMTDLNVLKKTRETHPAERLENGANCSLVPETLDRFISIRDTFEIPL